MAAPERGSAGTWEWHGFWDNGQLDTTATVAALAVDDLTASSVITQQYPGEIHHTPNTRSGTWYIWSGSHHQPDEISAISTLLARYAAEVQRLIDCARGIVATRATAQANLAAGGAATAAQIAQARKQAWEPWAAAEKYHSGLRRSAGLSSLREYLKSAPGVGISITDIADRWPEYLNCRSGVVHLPTKQLFPHDPRWMMTYCIDIEWNPQARGTGWEQLVWHVAGENPAVAQYLIRMLGYSLLGDNREQLVFFLTGPTGSGKSQLMEAVAKVLEPIAHSSTGALISRNKSERHARVENSIAGRRFVTIDESAERIFIDEGQLKRLSGSGLISRNKLYADTEIPTRVTWTIWQATNEMPTLIGFDDAIRRRLRAIPCGSTIPPEQRIKKLGEKLAETEGQAILASLIEGCYQYFQDGEQCPVEVELATAEYEAEQDTAALFRSECCMDVPQMFGTSRAPVAVAQAALRQEYVAWCQAQRISPLPVQAFGKAFRDLPGISWDKANKRYLGLSITSNYSAGRGSSDLPAGVEHHPYSQGGRHAPDQ